MGKYSRGLYYCHQQGQGSIVFFCSQSISPPRLLQFKNKIKVLLPVLERKRKGKALGGERTIQCTDDLFEEVNIFLRDLTELYVCLTHFTSLCPLYPTPQDVCPSCCLWMSKPICSKSAATKNTPLCSLSYFSPHLTDIAS